MTREEEQWELVSALFEAWRINNKQRFGQFLFNFLSKELDGVDIFSVTDKELLDALESKYGP